MIFWTQDIFGPGYFGSRIFLKKDIFVQGYLVPGYFSLGYFWSRIFLLRIFMLGTFTYANFGSTYAKVSNSITYANFSHCAIFRGKNPHTGKVLNIQNLPYFWNKKTHVVFFVFHFVLLYFFPNECLGLCQHRPGHSLGKKIKYHDLKNEKKFVGFCVPTFCQA